MFYHTRQNPITTHQVNSTKLSYTITLTYYPKKEDEQLTASPPPSPPQPATPPNNNNNNTPLLHHTHPLSNETGHTHPRSIVHLPPLQGPARSQTTIGVSRVGFRFGHGTAHFGQIAKYENGGGE